MLIIFLEKKNRTQVPVVGLTVNHLVYLTILFYFTNVKMEYFSNKTHFCSLFQRKSAVGGDYYL